MMHIVQSNIVTAFDKKTIGAKVINPKLFWSLLGYAVQAHNFDLDKTPGQTVLNFDEDPETLIRFVASGIAKKTPHPEDYVCRMYRGQPHLFLKRNRPSQKRYEVEQAFKKRINNVSKLKRVRIKDPVNFLRAVVYTKDGYLNDPDVIADQHEMKRIERLAPSHVLVAVLAGEVESFVSPYRFVANLAGGNHDYAEGKMAYADLVKLAQSVKNFDDEWAVVAD